MKTAFPKLRFPEFKDAGGWVNTPLDNALTPVVREVEKPSAVYTGLGVRSHGKGTFLKKNEDPEKNSMSCLYVVKPDDLIVNITFAWEGAIAIAKESDDGSLVSHRFPTYVFNQEITLPSFFQYIILNKRFIYDLGVISPGGAGRNRVLNKKDFLKLFRYLPSIPEQQKIAECLTSLDELIEAEGQKLETLRDHKKGLMQNLFPAEGQTLPKFRFPEFRDAGEWVKKRIGDEDFATLHKGKGVSKSDITADGTVPCIRYGELYTHYGEMIQAVLSKTNSPISSLFFSQENDVIIPASGETKIDIATASCVLASGVALGGDLNVIRSNHNGVFLSYYLNGPLKWEIARVAQGNSVVHLYPGQIMKIELFVPKLSEQRKIADCLSSLDDLITAQSQKIEALRDHKKGLLQQLFPSAEEMA
ncbi:restriction endonuclease subunit S [Terasakiella pusilla]|uniref:restriction endonuclease subunit S n=1 Tax=Terasakiella pusilla TaxID=64973 RepID=UPI003AA8F4CF